MKVYPVDLMRLYLTRRNLDGIAGIDLAGITPLVETTVKLGDGQDFDDKVRAIDLPADEGRGLPRDGPGRQPATPRGSCWSRRWSWRCSRRPTRGRVRVTVRDARDQGRSCRRSRSR